MTACIENCTSNISNQCQIAQSQCRFIKPTFLWTKSFNINWVCRKTEDLTWSKIGEEVVSDVRQEPILRHYYDTTILSHASLESALANLLATKLSDTTLAKDTLLEIFFSVLIEDRDIRSAVRSDLRAARERDPACLSHAHCLLSFKGFHALQAHRIAHALWAQGRKAVAVVIQSRVSEVFGVDIHPGAVMGSGIVIDHATGVVIGETAVVGDGVTLLHGVTLGGTGKVSGDRHPKLGDGVFIGAGSKLLGNIRIGRDARVGAASVVLKDVPANGTVVGNPARLIVR